MVHWWGGSPTGDVDTGGWWEGLSCHGDRPVPGRPWALRSRCRGAFGVRGTPLWHLSASGVLSWASLGVPAGRPVGRGLARDGPQSGEAPTRGVSEPRSPGAAGTCALRACAASPWSQERLWGPSPPVLRPGTRRHGADERTGGLLTVPPVTVLMLLIFEGASFTCHVFKGPISFCCRCRCTSGRSARLRCSVHHVPRARGSWPPRRTPGAGLCASHHLQLCRLGT